MEDIEKSVSLRCAVCGNDQFETLYTADNETENSEDNRFRCSDCGAIYTKSDLLEINGEALDIAADEIAEEALKKLEKDLKKAMKKWKF